MSVFLRASKCVTDALGLYLQDRKAFPEGRSDEKPFPLNVLLQDSTEMTAFQCLLVKKNKKPARLVQGIPPPPNCPLSMQFIFPHLYLGLIKVFPGSVGDCGCSWTQRICPPVPKLTVPQCLSHWRFLFGFILVVFLKVPGILFFLYSEGQATAFKIGFLCAILDLDI